MLKKIPPILSPELLKVLCEMGHGDRILLADGNFPAASVGMNAIVIRCDGHGVPELLRAVLELMPLDDYAERPVQLMAVTPGDETETPIWYKYAGILRESGETRDVMGYLERADFYDEAKKAYAVVATGETALYANIMLQKGVIWP